MAIRVTMTAADAKMEVTMIAVMILYLFLFYFRGSLCPPRHPYNTTTRTKFVRVVKFDALFVIFYKRNLVADIVILNLISFQYGK